MSLQYQCGVSSSAGVRSDDKLLEAGGVAGSMVKSLPQIKDIGEMKALVSGLSSSTPCLPEKVNTPFKCFVSV